VAWAINGVADEAVDMLGSLREAAPTPHGLDDATVDRVIWLYTEQQDALWLYYEATIVLLDGARPWLRRVLQIVRQDAENGRFTSEPSAGRPGSPSSAAR